MEEEKEQKEEMNITAGSSGIKWVFLFREWEPDQTQALHKSNFSLTHSYIQIWAFQVTAAEMSKCIDSNSGKNQGKLLL